MTITAQNVAIIIAEKNNIQPETHNAMLEVGQLPLLCHVINTISRLNFSKIIIAHDEIFSMKDREKTLLFAGNTKPLIDFIKVDFEQDSEVITQSIFQHVPGNANNILLINSNAPFVRAYSIYTALAALDSQNSDTLLLPSLVALGVKYHKASAATKNLVTEEYNQNTDSSSSIVVHNTSIIIAHAKILEKIMSVSIRQNQEVAVNNIIAFALQNGTTAAYVEVLEEEIVAIESNKQLLIAENMFQKKIRHQMIEQGVKMIAPDTVFFTANTKIAPNVTIHPYVVFGNDVVIESGSEIKSFSHIEGAYLEENTSIGPFARIRPCSNIKKYAKVGSFVEIKQSSLEPYSKVAHLSYIGDTHIGKSTNIGAGTITCNYDGINKHQTNIGQNCFIGANTNFVAPINIGNNVLIGAGSVITDDIQDNEFAVARSKQKNKKNKYAKMKTIAPTGNDA